MQGIPKEDVLCVSFDGTYPNCLCVDKDGQAATGGYDLADARAYKQAEEITKRSRPSTRPTEPTM